MVAGSWGRSDDDAPFFTVMDKAGVNRAKAEHQVIVQRQGFAPDMVLPQCPARPCHRNDTGTAADIAAHLGSNEGHRTALQRGAAIHAFQDFTTPRDVAAFTYDESHVVAPVGGDAGGYAMPAHC